MKQLTEKMCLFPVYWDSDKWLLQSDLIIQWSEESLELQSLGILLYCAILSSNLFCGSYEAVPYVEKEGQWLEIKRINNQIFIYKILSHEKNYSTAEEISRDLIGDTIHVGFHPQTRKL